MRLPRYPEYKPSGVQWLGEVPGHWSVVPFKQLVEFQNGADHKAVEVEDGYPVYGSGGVFAYASKYLYDGESVLLGRKGTIDRPVYVNGKFWTVDTMYWTHVLPGVNGRYCYYAATTIPFAYYSTNTALPSMTQGVLGAHLVARPPSDEQTAIATFLDRETAKIDALVTEQERLIALLKEKRQAVISRAVTKGLNPDAPMKPSGIDWLGDVPAHWDAVPLKHLVSFQSGGTPSKDNEAYWDGEIPWASAKDMKREILDDTADHLTQYAIEEGAANLVPATSVVVVVRGMILARTFPVTLLAVPMTINQDLKALLPSGALDAGFLAWYLRGTENESLNRLDEAGHGTKALRMEAWSSLVIALPPKEEQKRIAEYLTSSTERLDALASEAKTATEILTERRSALISAAVTGQIDVRNAA